MESTDLRGYATEAIKFWEPYRLLYNLALAAIVIAYFAIGYPQSKSLITVDFCLGLFLLAVIANVAYKSIRQCSLTESGGRVRSVDALNQESLPEAPMPLPLSSPFSLSRRTA
jgi:hypothetical protein